MVYLSSADVERANIGVITDVLVCGYKPVSRPGIGIIMRVVEVSQVQIYEVRQMGNTKLPWSEYSVGEVLVFNPSDRRFYTVREGEWMVVDDVPEEYHRMMDTCESLTDPNSELYCDSFTNLLSSGSSDSVESNELIQPGRIPDEVDEDYYNIIVEVKGLA